MPDDAPPPDEPPADAPPDRDRPRDRDRDLGGHAADPDDPVLARTACTFAAPARLAPVPWHSCRTAAFLGTSVWAGLRFGALEATARELRLLDPEDPGPDCWPNRRLRVPWANVRAVRAAPREPWWRSLWNPWRPSWRSRNPGRMPALARLGARLELDVTVAGRDRTLLVFPAVGPRAGPTAPIPEDVASAGDQLRWALKGDVETVRAWADRIAARVAAARTDPGPEPGSADWPRGPHPWDASGLGLVDPQDLPRRCPRCGWRVPRGLRRYRFTLESCGRCRALLVPSCAELGPPGEVHLTAGTLTGGGHAWPMAAIAEHLLAFALRQGARRVTFSPTSGGLAVRAALGPHADLGDWDEEFLPTAPPPLDLLLPPALRALAGLDPLAVGPASARVRLKMPAWKVDTPLLLTFAAPEAGTRPGALPGPPADGGEGGEGDGRSPVTAAAAAYRCGPVTWELPEVRGPLGPPDGGNGGGDGPTRPGPPAPRPARFWRTVPAGSVA